MLTPLSSIFQNRNTDSFLSTTPALYIPTEETALHLKCVMGPSYSELAVAFATLTEVMLDIRTISRFPNVLSKAEPLSR